MKKICFLIIVTLLLLFTVYMIVYADGGKHRQKTVENISLEENLVVNVSEDDEKVAFNKNEAISMAEQLKKILLKDNVNALQKESLKINEKNIELKQEHVTNNNTIYWEISDLSSRMKINAENGELISFMNKKDKFSKSTYSEELVKDIANRLYTSLSFNNDYELYYMENFDDELWTAYFSKKLDGIYNDFQSVRMTFSPVDEEIVFLVIKNEIVENLELNIVQDVAERIATEKFGMKNIHSVKSELKFIRTNEFFNEKYYFNNKKSTVIKKAWVVNINEKYLVYVDCNNGEIIGGDEYV